MAVTVVYPIEHNYKRQCLLFLLSYHYMPPEERQLSL